MSLNDFFRIVLTYILGSKSGSVHPLSGPVQVYSGYDSAVVVTRDMEGTYDGRVGRLGSRYLTKTKTPHAVTA